MPSVPDSRYNRRMGRASALHRLQQVDSEILRRRIRGEQIAAILSNSSEIQAVRRAREQNQERLDAAHADSREAEYAVQAQREKIEQTDSTLYGGSVTNPKELQDLQMEAESLRRHMETLEDRLLQAMLAADEIQEQERSLAAQLDGLEQQQAIEHASLLAERDQLASELDSLQAEREVAETGLSAEDLARYAALIERMGGLAVATLEEGTCGACGLTIAPSIRQTIRGGPELVNCPQCGRILYGG